MSDEILQPNTPVKFAARNMRPKFRRLKAGDIFLVEYEVDESVWNSLRTVPENALLETVLWHHDGDPEPHDQPAPEPKGPYSGFWRIMVIKGVTSYPDLQEKLDVTHDHVWDALHGEFNVKSMSNVSPRQWETWVTENGLHEGLITMSRNAEIQTVKEAK